jgi:hypothetical protein
MMRCILRSVLAAVRGATRVFALIFTVGLFLPSEGSPPEHRWPQFRGTSGAGVAGDAVDLPVSFGADTNVAWTCDVPLGQSSPCIWGDRIFLTAETGRDLRTICVDRTTGEMLWEQIALTDTFESRHGVNSAATPTPVTDDERVFVYFGSCGLIC